MTLYDTSVETFDRALLSGKLLSNFPTKKTMSEKLEFRTSIEIDAHPEKVWEALINPEKTRQYMFGCEVISNWKPGDPVIWRGASDGVDYVVGSLKTFIPNKKLAFTVFDPNAGYEDKEENYLLSTYTLEAKNGSTLLSVSQGDFSKVEDGAKRHADSAGGWNMTLDALKKLTESDES